MIVTSCTVINEEKHFIVMMNRLLDRYSVLEVKISRRIATVVLLLEFTQKVCIKTCSLSGRTLVFLSLSVLLCTQYVFLQKQTITSTYNIL